jgi:hypothetical protein
MLKYANSGFHGDFFNLSALCDIAVPLDSALFALIQYFAKSQFIHAHAHADIQG